MDFATIDFEASCLPRHGRSFPIEVGISSAAGTYSWLIKPHPLWRDWDWTDEAYALHGIRREQLEEEGLAPEIVMEQLLSAMTGKRVIADSMIDAYWWSTLATAAANITPPPIEYVGALFDELGPTTDQILGAQEQADLLCKARHRAGADARWLHIVIAEIQQALLEERRPLLRKRPFPRTLSWPVSAVA